MSDVRMEEWGDWIRVTSPYNEGFIEDVKPYGGRWDPDDQVWLVPRRWWNRVEKLLVHHYGSVMCLPEQGDDYIADRHGRASQGRLL
ncbi:MAG: hypothetical protein ACOC9H_02870 [Gemmatimonadota bacterium]